MEITHKVKAGEEFLFTPSAELSEYWVAAPASLIRATKANGTKVMIDNPSLLPARLEKDLVIRTLEPYQAVEITEGDPNEIDTEKWTNMVAEVKQQLKDAIAQPESKLTRDDRLWYLQQQRDQGKLSYQKHRKLLEGSLIDDDEQFKREVADATYKHA